eukprot:TRINITY_DN10055_c0_g1_i1.p1 TRINITY_DN10055_c0_g1~~TRINITY_DN10055_c0_g1_i1.p1  ORF type:complete len:799 (+),score=106.42 TRINITY_DN10055_c0_g1_i1:78-2474(+)
MLLRTLFVCVPVVAFGAEWEVGHMCVKNMAPVVLHWHATDHFTGVQSVESKNTPVGYSSCIDLSTIRSVENGHPIIATVKVVLGGTSDVKTRVLYKSGSNIKATFTCRGSLDFNCELDGIQAEMEARRICVKNFALLVMSWQAKDLTTGESSDWSSHMVTDQTNCIDLSILAGIQTGHRVSGSVAMVLGDTYDLATPVIYNPQSTHTAVYTCSGTTVAYTCTLDDFDHCDASENHTAATDWALKSLVTGSEFGGRWQNWFNNVQTCNPLFFPKNDAEIRSYLSYAKEKGYKVRVTGATHSAPGLVDDESTPGETKTVVISLGRYELNDATWCANGDFCLDKLQKLVRSNAGRSWLDLYAFMRPSGWFIPTQTAGYFFSIAGCLLGTVHGGAYGQTFVHGYVRRMRVMLWDGSVQVLAGDDLHAWRNSYGLLGILTAVEMDVVHRHTFEMYTKISDYQPWDEKHFWQFVAEDSEANLDLSFFAGSKNFSMTKEGIYGEYFVDFLTDSSGAAKFRTQGVLWKTPVNPKVTLTEQEMKDAYASKVKDIGTMREDGASKIPFLNDFLSWSGIQAMSNSPFVANRLIDFNYLGQDNFVSKASSSVNDGYWVGGAPNVNIAAFFLPIENSFAAFDYARSMVRARHYGGNEACYRHNNPLEFRFVQVSNVSLLSIVPPGSYVVSEVLGFTDAAPGTDSWQRAYAEIECEWITNLGGAPHIMKLHSFGEDADGSMKAFDPCVACKIFTDKQKRVFEETRKRYDPHDLFASGFAYDVMLKACPSHCSSRTRSCPPRGQPDCGRAAFV